MADIVYIYRASVPANTDSYIDWIECEGFYAPTHYIYNKNRSIDFAAMSGSVTASNPATTVAVVGECFPYPSCQCSYDPLPPTTTSTTLAPVNFVLTPYCTGSGINGTGTINVNTFSGGNGTYQSIAIGTTAGQAFAATPINLSGATSYEFTGLFNGTYHIIVRDSLGNYTTKNTIVDCINVTSTTSTTSTTTSTTSTSTTTSTTTAAPICTYNGGSAILINTSTTTSTSTTTTEAPTTTTTSTSTSTTTEPPTTTTTTTTTAAPDYDFYEAQQYECGARNIVGTLVIAFPAGTSVNYDRFYNSNTDLGTYAYQPFDTVISGPGLIMNTTAYLTIPLACPV
jgi:hypothetical protein